MASTYLRLHIHIVFSTKGRRPMIADEWRHELHRYLGGTVKGLGATPLAIGGIADHVHLLVAIRAPHTVADLVREIKKSSTEWVRSERGVRDFHWQEGYAALSVGDPERTTAPKPLFTIGPKASVLAWAESSRAAVEPSGSGR